MLSHDDSFSRKAENLIFQTRNKEGHDSHTHATFHLFHVFFSKHQILDKQNMITLVKMQLDRSNSRSQSNILLQMISKIPNQTFNFMKSMQKSTMQFCCSDLYNSSLYHNDYIKLYILVGYLIL